MSMRKRYSLLCVLIVVAALGCSGGGGGGASDVPNTDPTSTVPTNATFTISGTVQYEDKIYDDENGFVATALKAIRYADVELVDTATSIVLSAAQTNRNGFYSLGINTAGTVTTVYVRIISSATPTASQQIAVKNLSGNLYSYRSADISLAASSLTSNMTVSTSNTAGGAFNILDVMTNGFEFVDDLAGVTPLTLTNYWPNIDPGGTFYCKELCPQGTGIYVLYYPLGNDSDEYDDDVLYHEFGHFIAAQYSKDDSPGGAHSFSSNDLDMRLSWSEGWGDFFPGAVKYWLNATNPALLSSSPTTSLSAYVDLGLGGQVLIALNISTPEWTSKGNPSNYCTANPISTSCNFSTNEIAVAKTLWDLMAGDPGAGFTGYGMQPIWDVVHTQLTTTTPVNLDAFRDGWLALQSWSAGDLLNINNIYSERLIRYSADLYEPADDNISTASTYTVGVSAAQDHTLFVANDVDFVSFLVTSTSQTYTITTSNLRNGADTVTELYDMDQVTLLASNDNQNNKIYSGIITPSDRLPLCDAFGCHENKTDILGSSISYIFASTGTYYVKISSSSNRPVSSGRYGSYKISITSP